MAFENMKVGAAYPAGANLNERGFVGNLRPWHRTDHRLGTGTGEGSDADGAVAHGLPSVALGHLAQPGRL